MSLEETREELAAFGGRTAAGWLAASAGSCRPWYLRRTMPNLAINFQGRLRISPGRIRL